MFIYAITVHLSFDAPVMQAISVFFANFGPLFFFFDLFVNLNTGYYKRGTLIMNKLQILKFYLRNNCVFDIIPSIILLIFFDEITQIQEISYPTHQEYILLIFILKYSTHFLFFFIINYC